MSRTRWTAIAVALLCLALAAPAHAERLIVRDAVKDDGARDSDMTKMTTIHGEKRVVLKNRMHRDSRLSDEMWHLVDTVGDSTPDFLVFTVVSFEVGDHPSVGVKRIDQWPTRANKYRVLQDGETVDCALRAGRISDRHRLLTLTLGRGCFKTDGAMPERMRINSFATFDHGKVTDVVPAWHTYGRWTKAG